jgi:hypothetical protein
MEQMFNRILYLSDNLWSYFEHVLISGKGLVICSSEFLLDTFGERGRVGGHMHMMCVSIIKSFLI